MVCREYGVCSVTITWVCTASWPDDAPVQPVCHALRNGQHHDLPGAARTWAGSGKHSQPSGSRLRKVVAVPPHDEKLILATIPVSGLPRVVQSVSW